MNAIVKQRAHEISAQLSNDEMRVLAELAIYQRILDMAALTKTHPTKADPRLAEWIAAKKFA